MPIRLLRSPDPPADGVSAAHRSTGQLTPADKANPDATIRPAEVRLGDDDLQADPGAVDIASPGSPGGVDADETWLRAGGASPSDERDAAPGA